MQSKSKTIDFKGVSIYSGIATHLKNWRVTVMVEDIYFKTFSMNPKAKELSAYLKKHFPGSPIGY
jgi:uridine kinase